MKWVSSFVVVLLFLTVSLALDSDSRSSSSADPAQVDPASEPASHTSHPNTASLLDGKGSAPSDCGFDVKKDHPDDTLAMNLLWEGLQYKSWYQHDGHDPSVSVCCWIGVSCSPKTQRIYLVYLYRMMFSPPPQPVVIPDVLHYMNHLDSLTVQSMFLSDIAPNAFANTSITSLFLDGNQLTSFNQTISPSLNHLYLSNNDIRSIGSFHDLSNLTTLELSNNKHLFEGGQMPDWLHLPSLQVVKLDNTGLSVLPEAIGDMVGIEEMDLSFNDFQDLPETLCRISALHSLLVDNNRITDLPLCLTSLPSLVSLSLFPNDLITELPPVVATMPHLRFLLVQSSKLERVPSLMGMSSLEFFMAYNNQLLTEIDHSTVFAPNLTTIDVVDAPLLTEVPFPPQSGSLRNMRFKQIGMTRWDIGKLDFFPALNHFEITDTPLQEVTGSCVNENPFPAWIDIGEDDMPGALWHHGDISPSSSFGDIAAAVFSSSSSTSSSSTTTSYSTLPSPNPSSATSRYSQSRSSTRQSGNRRKHNNNNTKKGPSPLFRPELSHMGPVHVSIRNCGIRSFPRPFLNCFSEVASLDLSFNPLVETVLDSHANVVNITGAEISYVRIWGNQIYADNMHGVLLAPNDAPLQYQPGENNFLSMKNSTFKLEQGYNIIRDPLLWTRRLSDRVDTNIEVLPKQSLQCYPVVTALFKHRIIAFPWQFQYEHCRCLRQDMYWDSEEEVCVYRRIRGLRFAYNDSVAHPLHAVEAGYYPVVKETATYCNSTVGDLGKCGLLECIFLNRCNPHNDVGFHCSNGFDPSSLMCSKCPQGLFLLGDSCVECSSSTRFVVPVVTVLSLCALFVYVLYAHKRDFLTSSTSYASVSIFISWVQLAFVLIRLSRTMFTSEEGASAVMRLWEYISLPVFQVFSHPSLHCIDSSFDYISEVWLLFSAPWAVLVVALLISGVIWVVSNNRTTYFLSIVLYSTFFLWNLLYMSIAQRVFELMYCDSSHGSSYLVAAPYVSCDDPRFEQVYAMGMVMLVVFVAGLPSLFVWMIYRYEHCSLGGGHGTVPLLENPIISSPSNSPRSSPSASSSYATTVGVLDASARMLSGIHSHSLRYWTVGVTLLRKALIMCLVSLIPPRSALIPFSVVTVVLASLVLNITFQPYRHALDNRLETLFLSLATFSYVAGFFASVEGLDGGENLYSISITANVVIALAFVVVLPLIRFRSSVESQKAPHPDSS